MNTLNRRALLRGAVSASVLAAAPRIVTATSTPLDVLVIGAGLSGLYAAMLLEDMGARVQVIEGRDRIGGRMFTMDAIPGRPEAGGNAIMGGYGRTRELCRQNDITLRDAMPRSRLNRPVIVRRGEMIDRDDWARHAVNQMPEEHRAKWPPSVIWEMVAKHNPLDLADDWYGKGNAGLDVCVQSFLEGLGFEQPAIDLAYNTNPQYGSSAHTVSILQWFYMQYWFGLQNQIDPVALVAPAGNQRIPEVMAASLQQEVQLNRTVTGIRYGRGEAEVQCRDGSRFRARHVICSMPLPPMRWVGFDPQLPRERVQALHTVPQMLITQVYLVPKRAYWEDDGIDPGMWTDTPAGDLLVNRQGDEANEITSLTAWGRGFGAAYLDTLGEAQAGRAVVAAIEAIRPAARGQLEVAGFKSWQLDPWSGGDWVVWGPGQVTRYLELLGQPLGNLHFCGEHTARANRGMEGALESGERAAIEIAEFL
jgi:monoamine oxidase